jgi:hypothetical protein
VSGAAAGGFSTAQNLGPVKGTPGGGGPLGNWQIKGGSGAYAFSIDRESGVIKLADP